MRKEFVVDEMGKLGARYHAHVRIAARYIGMNLRIRANAGDLDLVVPMFGGVDIVVNNASAISITDSQATDMKRVST